MKQTSTNKKINVHPITLKFSGEQKNLEVSFNNDYFAHHIKHFRYCIIYSVLLYSLISLLDFIIFREQFFFLLSVRFFVVIPIFCIGFFYTFNKNYKNIWRLANNCFVVLTSVGFLTMMVYCPAPKSYSFYAGIIICLIFGYAYIRSYFLDASFAGLVVIILYIASSIKINTPFEIFINNFSYLFIANILGMIICYATELASRREFFLREMLKIEKIKVENVNQDLEMKVKKRTRELVHKTENLKREICERKRAEADLQLKNLVFESAITANSASNAESFLTNVNNTFLKLWGYKRKEDILGEPIVRFFKFEHEAKVVITSLDKTGVWEGEFTARKKDGNTFAAYGLATRIDSPSEGITGYQSSVIDISDRKKIENEKIEAQKIAGENEKLALVGQIAGKMAHDFNNLLGIIMGHTELALLDCKDLKMKNTFELIFNQTLRGKNLTKNLIAFAKSSEPKQEFFSINEKVDFVLKLLKNDLEGIEILKDEMENIEILADPGMIEHSLVNLIQNSIHATGLTDNPQITIRIHCLEKTMVLEIYDNGCGIPDEHIDNIYEPSFSLKGSQDVHGRYKDGIKGSGYGMANVKKYVELHNGNIFIESKLDKGTKVTIVLPIIEKELTKEETLEIQRTKIYSGKYILLVEDEPAISDVQYQLLTQAPINHEVDIASNGQAALKMLDKNQYDLISLDYMLPGNINGIDVYNHVRETNTSVPILFISGNIEFLESIEMLKQKDPYLSHVSKPCMNIDYLNSINKLFESMII